MMIFLLIPLIINGTALILSTSVYANENITLPSGRSLYVVDGDSVSIQTRIKGIDTPEIHQTCEPIKGTIVDCGKLAKRHLQKLLANSHGLLVINIIDFDKYSRALVSINKGKIDIAQQMVLDGFAYSYYKYPKEEQIARKKQLGFWQYYKPPISPKHWRKNHKKSKYKKRQ